MAIRGFQDTDCIENIVGKGEIAQYEQFHLFPQCFHKAFFLDVIKLLYMKEKVKATKPENVIENGPNCHFHRPLCEYAA